MADVTVKVPNIGDFKDVEIIELLVKVGDRVAAEQSLITVESDKASMEIPSSHAGVVTALKVAVGDKVNEGTVLLTLKADAEAASGAASPAPAPAVSSASPSVAPAPAAPAAMSPASSAAAPMAAGPVELLVPDIGDFDEVSVIEVFVKPGDTLRLEQSVITVESDKASMEIPAAQAGKVLEIKVKVGDKVKQGSVMALIEAVGAAPADAPAAAAPAATAPAVEAPPAPAAPAPSTVASHASGSAETGLPHASPSIRKTARELGVPLAEIKGNGPKGRITEADLQDFVKAVMTGQTRTRAAAAQAPAAASGAGLAGLLPWPQVDFAKFGAVERKDLSRIKKISGANLHRNWVVIPHVTNHDDADITELEAFRVRLNKENEKSGVKVTMLAFLIKACVAALKKFPEFNASLDGDQIVLKQYFHIGFAADTPNGLMVPVIKDADRKGVLAISTEMGELAKKARDGKLSPLEMSGGCISISSLGGIGGRYFTPIINAPEVAILGVCRSAIEPKWDGKAFQPRLMLPLSLSWDHRVIDGASAARFNAYLGDILADFRRVLL